MFKKIFISGGTGLIGKEIVRQLLASNDLEHIIVFSRNLSEQFNMSQEITDNRVSYIIGDIRDYQALRSATCGVDAIIHLAAMKFIDFVEENKDEAIKTNILGTQNIISAAKENCVKKVVFSSSDKACNPSTTYGVTKLLGEKLIRSSSTEKTIFSAFRFSNVIGTNGSIFKKWLGAKKIEITNKECTRFFISIEDAAKTCIYTLNHSNAGDLIIPKMKAARIYDIAKLFNPTEIIESGLRTNEKIHEDMLSYSDMGTIALDGEYLIIKNDNYFSGTSINSSDYENNYSQDEILQIIDRLS